MLRSFPSGGRWIGAADSAASPGGEAPSVSYADSSPRGGASSSELDPPLLGEVDRCGASRRRGFAQAIQQPPLAGRPPQSATLTAPPEGEHLARRQDPPPLGEVDRCEASRRRGFARRRVQQPPLAGRPPQSAALTAPPEGEHLARLQAVRGDRASAFRRPPLSQKAAAGEIASKARPSSRLAPSTRAG
jgi:hypothetical protein